MVKQQVTIHIIIIHGAGWGKALKKLLLMKLNCGAEKVFAA